MNERKKNNYCIKILERINVNVINHSVFKVKNVNEKNTTKKTTTASATAAMANGPKNSPTADFIICVRTRTQTSALNMRSNAFFLGGFGRTVQTICTHFERMKT